MGSVRVTYFDSEAVRAAVESYARALGARDPGVEEVILFGSVVSGTPTPGSDADLLIVLRASDRPFLDRIPAYLPTDLPVGADVFPYTREELRAMEAEGNGLIRRARRDGLTVFRRSA